MNHDDTRRHRSAEAVRRVLARDDLLQLAYDAHQAVGIMRQREARAGARAAQDVYQEAFDRNLRLAHTDGRWSVRAQAFAYAGSILRFCTLIDIVLTTPHEPGQLYVDALGALSDADADRTLTLERDLTLAVFLRYRAARERRLSGDIAGALELSLRTATDLYGTGAEPYRAHFEYEAAASLITAGQQSQVNTLLSESAGYWQETDRTRFYSTAHRFSFALSLASWSLGDLAATAQYLTRAAKEARRNRQHTIVDSRHDLSEISVRMSMAEFLMAGSSGDESDPVVHTITRLGIEVLETLNQMPQRWQVMSGAPSPMGLTIRRLYGDLARLASMLPGPAAAHLGLAVAQSAKQAGIAAQIRSWTPALAPRIAAIVEDVVRVELDHEKSFTLSTNTARTLQQLRVELELAGSPTLAEAVLPSTITELQNPPSAATGYILDFVGLPDCTRPGTTWYRTSLGPDIESRFEQLTRGAEHAFLPDTATMLLPADLLAVLARTDRAAPIRLTISPHGPLNSVPWPGLVVDAAGNRLVTHALITQTLLLRWPHISPSSPIVGSALVRLIPRNDPSEAWLRHEAAAWGLHPADDRVLAAYLDIATADPLTTPAAESLASQLRKCTSLSLLHLAASGEGSGLAQVFRLPEPLSAGQALAINWPPSVLMTSCQRSEPLGIDEPERLDFVTAVLISGSRHVVAPVSSVPQGTAAALAALIVAELRAGQKRLDCALRIAQLQLSDTELTHWAAFAAYEG